MDTWRQAGLIGVALLFGWKITNAVELAAPGGRADDKFDFDIPALPLRSAAERFAALIGADVYIGHTAFEACGDFLLDPVVGRFTARDAWTKLTAPICAASGVVTDRPGAAPVYMVDHPWVSEREIRIPRAPLIDALRTLSDQFGELPIEYRATDTQEEQTRVGPIVGRMGPEEALRRIEVQTGSHLRHRRSGSYVLVLEPDSEAVSAKFSHFYGRTCSCPVSIEGLLSETVTVEKSKIRDDVEAGVVRFTRQYIESTGAATLPEFFRYVAQSGYSRTAGYTASGAQYADLRGLGLDTHLVTINGRRTLPSANNVSSSAFDLNTIPLPSVEHVDIHLDSAAMRYGSDAIAGTIDIVTRRTLDKELDLRYATSSGGATEQRATLGFGGQDSGGRFAAMLDYFQLGDLLGSERPLSRDQDYSRFGGDDYRQAFAITSINDSNLMGLDAPLAGLPEVRHSDDVSVSELTSGKPQMISLSKYQSLVPSGTRASFVGSADYSWPGLQLSADALWVRRKAEFRYFPPIASGLVSEQHPGNPFEEPVLIDALLTGAPSMRQHVDSTLRRAVLSARGQLKRWSWDLSVLSSEETAQAWVDHELDPEGTAAALSASDESSALNVFAMRPGGPNAPAGIWAQPQIEKFSSSGEHVITSVEGPVGPAHVRLGLERRAESMQFSSLVGSVERDVRGKYAHITLPLIHPAASVFGVHELTALAGVRRDSFSDADAVLRKHFELKWHVTEDLALDVNIAQQYRPPSLFELNLPKFSVPLQVYDGKRQEVVSVMLLSGGNPNLRPTRGESTNIEVEYSFPAGLVAQLNYFSIRLWDRVAVLPAETLLAAEDDLPGRVLREEQTPEERAAGKPGRLALIDTSRDNIGRLFTTGLDVSLRKTFEFAAGSLMPRVDVTRIEAFRYSDVPSPDAPMIDRVGIASEQGTITRWRAVASLGWQSRSWAVTTHLRLIPSYDDVDGRKIRSQQLWDLNVSYSPSERFTLTLGAVNLANTSPRFARIGAAMGYDSSQWEPVGRKGMLTAKVSL